MRLTNGKQTEHWVNAFRKTFEKIDEIKDGVSFGAGEARVDSQSQPPSALALNQQFGGSVVAGAAQ